MRKVQTNFAIFTLLLAVLCLVLAEESPKVQDTEISGRSLHTFENDTTAEIIEQLLQSRREGRNLDEQFNQVYADGYIDQALMQGNDVEARNIIREKLCGLGLMSCDYEEKRPLYSTIYAQEMPPPPPPQHIRGGGFPRPPPTFNSGPPPTFNSGPPPPRIGYESSYKPTGPGSSFNSPSYEYTAPGQSFISSGPPTGEHIIYTKPPGPVYSGPSAGAPYVFEKPGPPIKKLQITSSASSSQSGSFYTQQSPDTFAAPSDALLGSKADTSAGLQQHVHHHYHHLEGDSKIPAVTIPVTGSKAITTDFGTLAQSSSAFNIDQSSAFTAGFNGASHGSLLLQPGSIGDFGSPAQKPNGEPYKPTATLNSLNSYTGNHNELYQTSGTDFNAGPSNSFVQSGFSPSSASYHSQNPDYYKKELHNFDGGLSTGSNFNGISSGYAGSSSHKYNGIQETSRQQFVDCECVPVNQCPSGDRIGRKEDLILPIDPRNLPKDIEALNDDQLTQNGTTTTTEAPKKDTEDKSKRAKREADNSAANPSEDEDVDIPLDAQGRAYYGRPQAVPGPKTCRINEVCCRRPFRPPVAKPQYGRCGVRNAAGITGRIKNPVYVDGDAEFGEYPWHVAILKKDPHESIYACGATLIDAEHVITAAHCIKSQNGFDLRARLGEWDVNHDVEFFPYIERDVVSVHVHPEYYAGTLDNDIAILKLDHPVDFTKNPHISPACLPDNFTDWTGARCWTTGWGKDAFGEHGKYQNILKEVDVPILSHQQCEAQLQHTRLGYGYKLNPGFVCAGGEEGKDACKGDGGGPLVCERNGQWNAVGIVSWGIGCGQVNVPGVYVRVQHYLDWIHQITHYYKK